MTPAEIWLKEHGHDLVALRRDLHAHPELSYAEHRTTELIERYLEDLDLAPRRLAHGTGVICEIGSGGPVVGLRADIDALPLTDLKDVPYRSRVEGVAHACGHDAHTAILLGAAAVLAGLSFAGTIRLIFQPAEESVPGGALSVIEAGAMKDLDSIYALHCDPRLDLGRVGVRVGGITAACDALDIALTGPGGHTGRPHLTVDLIYALGRLITDLPAMLGRRVDARAALTLVWGAVESGRAVNAIPMTGQLRGTLRVADREVWYQAEELVRTMVEQILAPTGALSDVNYFRGVPPVVNTADAVERQRSAVLGTLGEDALATTAQSMGGEDFAWYLEHVHGALARLGVRSPGAVRQHDLHQGTFDLDEDALAIGVRYTVALALGVLADPVQQANPDDGARSS